MVHNIGCRVKFIMHKDTAVYSEPPSSLLEFINQRMRYASKGLLYYKLESFLYNIEKEELKGKKVNVVTVTPELIDPIFYYLLIDTTVNYDPVTNLTDETTLKTNIKTSIESYLQSNLEKFDQKFRHSKLVQDIDNTNDSIRNNKTLIKYQQKITPVSLSLAADYTLNFNNRLEKGSVTSTSFVATDGFTYVLVDDSAGVIRASRQTVIGTTDSPAIYFVLTDGSTQQGTIDYDTGKVVLSSLTPVTITDATDSIKFTVTPELNNSDITPLRQQILTYDFADITAITINMVAETII